MVDLASVSVEETYPRILRAAEPDFGYRSPLAAAG